MDPTRPSQPPKSAAYNTSGNPTSHTPSEGSNAASNASSNSGSHVDHRKHDDIQSTNSQDATPSSLGYGARDTSGDTDDSGASHVDENPNSSAEQMAPSGEGDVARAQGSKTGFGEQEDLASDLDAKKKEQEGRREEVKRERASGALGDEGYGGRVGVVT